MKRTTSFFALSCCALLASASQAYPTNVDDWLKILPGKDRNWQTCPIAPLGKAIENLGGVPDLTVRTEALRKAYDRNPFFGYNGVTDDRRFSCRQIGPFYQLRPATRTVRYRYFVQEVRNIRPKVPEGLKASNIIRFCSTSFVDPNRTDAIKVTFRGKVYEVGPLGCGIIARDDFNLPIG